jgi:hypothetical protein
VLWENKWKISRSELLNFFVGNYFSLNFQKIIGCRVWINPINIHLKNKWEIIRNPNAPLVPTPISSVRKNYCPDQVIFVRTDHSTLPQYIAVAQPAVVYSVAERGRHVQRIQCCSIVAFEYDFI